MIGPAAGTGPTNAGRRCSRRGGGWRGGRSWSAACSSASRPGGWVIATPAAGHSTPAAALVGLPVWLLVNLWAVRAILRRDLVPWAVVWLGWWAVVWRYTAGAVLFTVASFGAWRHPRRGC